MFYRNPDSHDPFASVTVSRCPWMPCTQTDVQKALAPGLPRRYPQPSRAEARGCGQASPVAALPLLRSSHEHLPSFPLWAWQHRWIQNPAHRLMSRESFSRFRCNQQPWQIGRLPLVGQAVFLGADSFKWDLLKCFCTNS